MKRLGQFHISGYCPRKSLSLPAGSWGCPIASICPNPKIKFYTPGLPSPALFVKYGISLQQTSSWDFYDCIRILFVNRKLGLHNFASSCPLPGVGCYSEKCYALQGTLRLLSNCKHLTGKTAIFWARGGGIPHHPATGFKGLLKILFEPSVEVWHTT